MNKIEALFADRATIRGGVIMFSKMDSIQFVRACKAEGIGILGVDGFLLTDEATQPSMENSIDFSSAGCKDSETIYEEAILFLERGPDGLFFEIVCND